MLSDIRRHMLVNFEVLPISGEYIHRDAFDIAAKYGKDTFWVIKKFGTHWLPKLFSLKIKRGSHRQKILLLPQHLSDKLMQTVSKFIPEHLPQSLWDYRKQIRASLNYQNGWKRHSRSP